MVKTGATWHQDHAMVGVCWNNLLVHKHRKRENIWWKGLNLQSEVKQVKQLIAPTCKIDCKMSLIQMDDLLGFWFGILKFREKKEIS
jgi:hypothetical protein